MFMIDEVEETDNRGASDRLSPYSAMAYGLSGSRPAQPPPTSRSAVCCSVSHYIESPARTVQLLPLYQIITS
ncbi:hypothetical protein E2C01_099561 [Portunus trituberculatus]|uniref:Uncharacterized protein n=1 Tax=Portunus trituberculatus TaxID=210409 RepID=A0A5B7K5T2_PORTR|nr:hypothetical protein [Portunus trituberculatus]